MELDKKKIITGIFIGGICFGLVAHLWAPKILGLVIATSILVSVSAGYVGYDVIGFMRAIPIAVSNTYKEMRPKKDPFCEAGALVALIVFLLVLPMFMKLLVYINQDDLSETAMEYIGAALFMGMIVAVFTKLMIISIMFLANLGARHSEKVFWYPFTGWDSVYGEKEKNRLIKSGLSITSDLSLRNIIRWAMEGVSVAFFYSTLSLMVGFAMIFPTSWKFIRTFSRKLIKLVHCEGRVTAAVYAPSGALVSFLYFHFFAGDLTFIETAMAIIFGAIASVSVGLILMQTVFKNILQNQTMAECS